MALLCKIPIDLNPEVGGNNMPKDFSNWGMRSLKSRCLWKVKHRTRLSALRPPSGWLLSKIREASKGLATKNGIYGRLHLDTSHLYTIFSFEPFFKSFYELAHAISKTDGRRLMRGPPFGSGHWP